jgi:hypothetical protein
MRVPPRHPSFEVLTKEGGCILGGLFRPADDEWQTDHSDWKNKQPENKSGYLGE